jgi:hypothetical protein
MFFQNFNRVSMSQTQPTQLTPKRKTPPSTPTQFTKKPKQNDQSPSPSPTKTFSGKCNEETFDRLHKYVKKYVSFQLFAESLLDLLEEICGEDGLIPNQIPKRNSPKTVDSDLFFNHLGKETQNKLIELKILFRLSSYSEALKRVLLIETPQETTTAMKRLQPTDSRGKKRLRTFISSAMTMMGAQTKEDHNHLLEIFLIRTVEGSEYFNNVLSALENQ